MSVWLMWLLYHRGGDPSGEFLQHLVHLVGVDPSIHPASAVWGHLAEVVFQRRDQIVVADLLTETTCLLNVGDSETVHGLVVVDPQGGIPGFVVGPSVECGGSGHLISFVWYTAIVGHDGSDFRPEWTVLRLSHCRSTRLHRLAPSGSVRHQGSLARSSCRP